MSQIIFVLLLNIRQILVKYKILYRRQALITIQKTVRGYLARKKHGVRITGIRKIRALDAKLKQMENVAAQLKKDKESSMKEIISLSNEINASIEKIKVGNY